MTLYYSQDIYASYDAQLYDTVDATLDDGIEVEALVVDIKPRQGALCIHYEDPIMINKKTGAPKRRTATIPVSRCNLIRRDG